MEAGIGVSMHGIRPGACYASVVLIHLGSDLAGVDGILAGGDVRLRSILAKMKA